MLRTPSTDRRRPYSSQSHYKSGRTYPDPVHTRCLRPHETSRGCSTTTPLPDCSAGSPPSQGRPLTFPPSATDRTLCAPWVSHRGTCTGGYRRIETNHAIRALYHVTHTAPHPAPPPVQQIASAGTIQSCASACYSASTCTFIETTSLSKSAGK